MRVTQEKATVSGDLVFSEQVGMEFDPSAMDMQIRNMIRMYANPRLAALREYTSNARDAHQAAGYKGAVEVTLPTSLHPFLTIVDHGVGLSREEVKGFGQFGRSTKNNSDEYIGGFGLGSKSGLAVAPQFTVLAVKDGKKNVVVVGWDSNGRPSLGFLDEQDTTESNGVTIQIPSETGHGDWTNIARGNTFMGWERGSILVNGKEPEFSVHDTAQFKPLAGGWMTLAERVRSYGAEDVHALVHGVYYAIPASKFGEYTIAQILRGSVLKIENGSVDILPSRDDLEWTDRTSREVRRVADMLVKSIVAEYASQIAKVKTFKEAKKIADAMEEVGLPTKGLTHNGVLLDWTREPEAKVTLGKVKASGTAKSGWQNERSATTTRSASIVHRQYAILVTGCTGETATGYYRKEQRFVNESSDTTAFVVAEATASGQQARDILVFFTNRTKADLPQGFVLAMTKVMTVQDFQKQAVAQRKAWASDRAKAGAAVGKPKQSDRVLRVVGSYNNWSYNFYLNERPEQTIIAAGTPVVVLHADDDLSLKVMESHTDGTSSLSMRLLMQFIAEHSGAGTTFVVLAKNHKADNLVIQGWKPLSVWLRETLATTKVRTPMELAVEAYRLTRPYSSVPTVLTPEQIAQVKNKKLREWLTAYAESTSKSLGVAESVARSYPSYAPTQPEASTYSPLDHYPLIAKMGLDRKEGGLLVDYVNMVDSARKANR